MSTIRALVKAYHNVAHIQQDTIAEEIQALRKLWAVQAKSKIWVISHSELDGKIRDAMRQMG